MIKSSHKGYAETLLFVLNIFLLFLLFFGDRIIIPLWLQPIGRLHPLVLHFPIVLLIVAMILEFFRFKPSFFKEQIYQDFTTTLLLAGALLAAITAIMGLFLSKEQGYSGHILQWHKWTGVSIVFVASAIYWCRKSAWYRVPAAKGGAVLLVCCLAFAGHFGADITHGEGFILAPVMRNGTDAVPLEQAQVYRDVIQPIFENKCISCHNDDKLKGGLMLTDEGSIVKGGKTGKLFVPGNPQISLILQRVHLPEDDKDHMPPSGKPQLTPDEMALLYFWIKENAGFKKKVIELPEKDSLRLLASTHFKSAGQAADAYDFVAADEKIVKKLNNNYRVIYPLAKESSALAVNVYNKTSYTPKVLEELSEIKKQVVSLNLNKMPVKDAELKTIAQFENLRELNLNFTDITGSGLKYLIMLKHLKTLSLAGTTLNQQDIKQMVAIKSLKELAIWNTGLKDAEIQQLKKANKNITFNEGFKDNGKPIKLNTPQIKNTVAVFAKPFALNIWHPIKGVDIRYTTDGTIPDSVRSPLYKPGIMIAENTTVKARAYKPGWYGSDVIESSFYKSGSKPDSIWLSTPPMPENAIGGAKSLIDDQLGNGNLGVNWLGFRKTDMVLFCQYKKPVTVSDITLRTVTFPEYLIVGPAVVQVWGGTDLAHLKLLSTTKLKQVAKTGKLVFTAIECKFKPRSISIFKLVAKPGKVKIDPPKPAPKPAKPAPKPVKPAPKPQPVMFFDEVLVN